MTRQFCFVIFFLASACAVFAQSGRNRANAAPTPTPHPRGVYTPTENFPTDSKPTPAAASANPSNDVDDGEVIRVESALVPIPASVTDSDGNIADNLRLEDFQLEVGGKPAEISEISRSQTPVRLALLFDNSSSVTSARDFEKKAAVRFFKQVIRPNKDLAALYSVSTYSKLEQPLTKNVSSLVAAIENFDKPEGATALLDGIISAANYLKSADGRRVIVILSDGEDTYSDLSTTLEKTVKTVQSANCQVYIVKTTDFENFKQSGIRGGNANIRSLTAERRMQEIANQTGGAVYSPIDERELDAAFVQISSELAQQYILSYYPDENAPNGEFRTISLKVKSHPNLTVRTRKGYYVSRR